MDEPAIMSANAEANPEVGVPLVTLWQEAVGRVFKLVSKPYGVRQVTYTEVKAVKESDDAGGFDVEVRCVDIIARVIEGKRAHSNICKEGVLHQSEEDGLPPESFGQECPVAELQKVTEAILAYTNSYLEWVIQDAPEEQTEISIPVDLPCLRLTAMEASLVRNSPFLAGDRYFLTPNSLQAALASAREEMNRAARNMHLPDAVDPVYIAEKNTAVENLRRKLDQARQEAHAAVRRDSAHGLLLTDSLCLALLGKPSATALSWVTANPSEDGVVASLGLSYTPLDFVRWAQVSGRQVPEEQSARRNLRDYFRGWNHSYTGPDADGIYPLMRPATD